MSEHSTNRKQESEHIVAFLDLLGATEKIKSAESEKYLNKLSTVFELSKKRWPAQDDLPYKNIKCVTFSDNIAFAMELTKNPTASNVIENEDLSAIETILQFISYIGVFQSCALEYGLLFRGGISLGKLYINPNENLIWGKALTEAHDLEAQAAIYPRVVLSRRFTKLPFDLQKFPHVSKDFDGMYFVDYMSQIVNDKKPIIEETKLLIQDGYFQAKQKENKDTFGWESILAKYDWLHQYIEHHI